MIDLQKVNKLYHGKSVVKDVQLTIPEKKLTAFIGPNGAGKSTVLSMISRLIPKDTGEIYLDHNEVKAWKSNELAKKLSILRQSNEINVQITVKELVEFGRFPYTKGKLTTKDEEIVQESLEHLGLEEIADQSIDTLSGGQLQRAYIAMVLAQDTDYILLDEPLNNLDMNFAVQIMQILKKLVVGILILASFGLAACGNSDNTSQADTKKSSTQAETALTIKDSNGDQIEVPKNPEKVVVFDNGSLDTMDALGVGDKVVGAATSSLPEYLSSYKKVESAGGIKEPDLEKINQLQPDLIIISGRQRDFQKDLSQIAPTIFLSLDAKNPWESFQQNFTDLGEIFGKQEEAKTQLEELSSAIDQTKKKAEATDKKALVTLVNEGQLSAYGSGSRFGFIHDLFGFEQADDQIEASTHGQSVSYEYVLEKNPDILFVVDRTKAIGGDDSKDDISANELVAQTNAGKNQQIISLEPDVWYLSGGGLESMKLMIEDVNQAFK
ncbi:ABC transporter substrate-binding protein [Enterococcus faecium]|nr:hypothetical protein [Enterococcus faecium]EME7114992.1 ABC transporter substrate-binding protein [Enterococcus faecium]